MAKQRGRKGGKKIQRTRQQQQLRKRSTVVKDIVERLTFRTMRPLQPYVRRRVIYPCGCSTRVAGLPKIKPLDDDEWDEPNTIPKVVPRHGALSSGLHIDAEFVYETTACPRQWSENDGSYLPEFTEHHPGCDALRGSQPSYRWIAGDETILTCHRSLVIRRLEIRRCGHQRRWDYLPRWYPYDISNGSRRQQRELDWRPVTLTTGVHLDAEFCYEATEHRKRWCKECRWLDKELVETVEGMYKGNDGWFPTVLWEGETGRTTPGEKEKLGTAQQSTLYPG